MKKLFMVLVMTLLFSAFTFANYFDDIRYFKGKKVEIILANNDKSQIGIFKDTSELMKTLYGVILESEDGAITFIGLTEIAAIKEIK